MGLEGRAFDRKSKQRLGEQGKILLLTKQQVPLKLQQLLRYCCLCLYFKDTVFIFFFFYSSIRLVAGSDFTSL